MDNYITFATILYIFSYVFYSNVSHGLGHKAEYLQLRRFIPCAILAVLPMQLASLALSTPQYLLSLLVGISWIITYPSFYYLTYHKSSSDFGFHLDTVFGLYIMGWLVSLKILVSYFHFVPLVSLSIISVVEFFILMIPLTQVCYYALYRTCIYTSAVTMVFETYTNEVLEFFKSLPIIARITSLLMPIAVLTIILHVNFKEISIQQLPLVNLALLIATTIFLTIYLWNTRKGVFIRT